MYFGAGRKQQAEEPVKEPAGSKDRKRASAGKIHREKKTTTPQHHREEEHSEQAHSGEVAIKK
eukprot:8024597-Heterocapsa_arctica.AAC.1